MNNDSDHHGPSRTPTLRDLAAPLFRQRYLVIGCFAAVSLAVAAAVLTSPRVYEAELKILVKHDRVDPLVSGNPGQVVPDNREVSEQELMSEVELLKGRDLLESVAQATGLHEQPRVRARARNRTEALALAIAALQRDLTIAPVRKTRMIEVSYISPDPRLARNVVETLSRLYLEKHLAVRRPPGVRQFFSDQMARSRDDLNAARARLDEFTARTRVVSADAEKESALQKQAEFEGTQRQAEAALAETGRRIAALEAEMAQTPANRTSEVRTSDDAELMRELKSRILTLDTKRAELLRKFTPGYRAVVEVEQQLQQARAALDEAERAPVRQETVAVNPTRQWVENEIARARTEQAALAARARSLGAAAGDYRARAQQLELRSAEQQELLRDVKAAEEQYLLYQRKQEEARISDALDRTRITNVAIAQAPGVSFEPHRSRSVLWLPVGLFVALALSLTLAFAVDAMSGTIRTPDELRAALDVPMLAFVPASRRGAGGTV
jgi:uncharacterized protein involved in exopolysaccharide biosynthesis